MHDIEEGREVGTSQDVVQALAVGEEELVGAIVEVVTCSRKGRVVHTG